MSDVHSKAEVHADCHVGSRTRVWQFASVIRGSKVGEDCNIASCAIVDGATLGRNVIVGHGSFIAPGIVLEDDVFVGPGVVFCNDYWPRVSKVGWFIQQGTVVTRVKRGASIGAGVVVLPGIVVGEEAMVAAGARVRDHVPPGFLLRRDGLCEPIHAPPSRVRCCT